MLDIKKQQDDKTLVLNVSKMIFSSENENQS